MYVHVWRIYVCLYVCMDGWKSEDILHELFFTFHIVDPGIELRSSGPEKSLSHCCAVLLACRSLLLTFVGVLEILYNNLTSINLHYFELRKNLVLSASFKVSHTRYLFLNKQCSIWKLTWRIANSTASLLYKETQLSGCKDNLETL